MSSETRIFQCTECNHAPFDTRIKLNKHAPSRHRTGPNSRVPSSPSASILRALKNQLGVKFQGYALLEIVDLSDLGNLLHNSQDESFELLKKLFFRMLETSREDTMAGFQPLLGKVMVGDLTIQEHATIENYATIWAKVLWIAWLAVMGSGTLHRRLELTNDQKTAVHDLIHRIALLKSRAGITGADLDSSALASVARLSMTVLLQQFDVVNRVLPSGESGVSQYLIARAINLLSLRPNGSFLSYMQITHITAAIRYALLNYETRRKITCLAHFLTDCTEISRNAHAHVS
ncbi:hypothetical protein V1524DRAFT_411897 [Lipomyces starkeyi]